MESPEQSLQRLAGLYRLTAEATDWQQQQVADRIMDSGDPCSPSVVVAYLTDHDIVPDLFLMLGWDPYIQRAHVLDKTGKVHMLRPHCIIGELGDKEQAKGLAGIQVRSTVFGQYASRLTVRSSQPVNRAMPSGG